MELSNQIMLVTYADSLGKNLKELEQILEKYWQGAVGGIHILPFFPSSADRGFAPLCYDRVEKAFGSFEDIERLAGSYYLMFDFMVNHISRQSEFFRDFEAKKDDSEYKDFFVRYKDFWDGGEPTKEQIDRIYKRKPRAPYVDVKFGDGTIEKIWCTFGEEQIDLNISAPVTQKFIKDTLIDLCKKGAAVIRLDAFAFAVKKPDTSCFFVEPEIWKLLSELEDIVRDYRVMVLPEIHTHYSLKMKMADRHFWIYDFALPVLTLNALYFGNGHYLKNWLLMSPKHQFTTLDTHDGIGIIDGKDLLSDEELKRTKEKMFLYGANVKKIYNTDAYGNLDVYQVNTTYYSALGNRDDAYLLARAIQFFAPGIPQVYYVGLLAGKNDLELLEQTKEGRNINRHYYNCDEAEQEMERPVVQRLAELMRFRNIHPAFNLDGEIAVELPADHRLIIRRSFGDAYAVLDADLEEKTFEMNYSIRKSVNVRKRE